MDKKNKEEKNNKKQCEEKENIHKEQCKCNENHCKEDCCCDNECHCEDECCCDDECHCGENCDCDETCECGCQDKSKKDNEYLNLARQVQADFDNYRKRTIQVIESARIDGIATASKEFFKAIDVLEKAKKDIKDENTVKGLDMVENSILDSLKSLGIVQIKALGEKFNHNLHSAVAVLQNNEMDDDIVVEEYQKGYMLNDKVLRYSQVIINKNEKENK